MDANPRGTHLFIADIIRQTIRLGGYREGLPSLRELMVTHAASRGVIDRALNLLKEEGLVESVKGLGWFVTGTGDRRPTEVRMREFLRSGDFAPGDTFASENDLTARLGISRVSVRRALGILEGEGLLSKATPRGRTVLTLSTDKEES